MEKYEIKQLFTTLSPCEKELVQFCAIVCREPYSIDAFIRFFGSKDPHKIDSIIRSLIDRNWFCCAFGNDFCCTESVANAVVELFPPSAKQLDGFLKMHLEMLLTYDDSSGKCPFDGAARMLQYILSHSLTQVCHQTFVECVLAFAVHAELATSQRGVKWLEERLDFQLLMAAERMVENQSLFQARLNIKIGKLYTNVFRYSEAGIRLESALDIFASLNEIQPVFIIELYMVFACFYEFQGRFANAIDWAYRAHQLVPTDGSVCAYIAYVCALVDARRSSRKWLKKAQQLIGDVPEMHPIHIVFLQISALHCRDSKDLQKSLAYLDSAKHLAAKIWGPKSPWAGWLAGTLQTVLGSACIRNDAYREYVEFNQFNFGYSLGATAMLYAGYILDELSLGNLDTANKYLQFLMALKADSPSVSPLVRFTMYITLAVSHVVNQQYDDSRLYIRRAWNLYHQELQPDKEVLAAIAPVFISKNIPNGVMYTDYLKLLLDICLRVDFWSKNYSGSIEFVQSAENDEFLSNQWFLHILQSRLAIEQGNIEEAKRIWSEVLNTSTKKIFARAKEIAECAYFHGLIFDARTIYELALTSPAVYSAKTEDLIDAKEGYAIALAECGQTQQADEEFAEAIGIAESLNNHNRVALLYYAQATIHQDIKAVQFLELAIQHWKSDSVFDEQLSKMYRLLAINMSMIGRHEESRKAAQKAISLYPTACPPESFFEDLL